MLIAYESIGMHTSFKLAGFLFCLKLIVELLYYLLIAILKIVTCHTKIIFFRQKENSFFF